MLNELEPKEVIRFFREMSEIPHGTYNVDRISDYLADFARERKLSFIQDALKNVIIFKEATKGYEGLEPVIIQGHMDMVTVKDADADIDMATEGLCLDYKDGFIYAHKTSLGGDDGIALAMALAILDSNEIPHPPLEVVCTVNEEVGMDGALGIDLSPLKGKKLLNIDSEEEGVLTVSCAGGIRVSGEISFTRSNEFGTPVFISIEGLKGGHSGTEIHLKRANGAHLLADILGKISSKYDIFLNGMYAGEKDNAIPNNGSAEILVSGLGDIDEFMSLIQKINDEINLEYEGREDDIYIEVGIQTEGEEECLSKADTEKVIDYIQSVPDGVISMCEGIDMVETSLNLGILRLNEDFLKCDYALRSSVKAAKGELVKKVTAITEDFGGQWETFGDYPAWEYLKESPLRDKMVEIFERQYGHKPVVEGVHAGLECGILSEKIPGLEAVSFGPNLLDIHTTRERMDVESVKRTWEYLKAILAEK